MYLFLYLGLLTIKCKKNPASLQRLIANKRDLDMYIPPELEELTKKYWCKPVKFDENIQKSL